MKNNNTSTIQYLLEIQQKGVIATIEDKTVKFKVAKGKILSPEEIHELKNRKDEILAFLLKEGSKIYYAKDETNRILPFDRKQFTKIPLSFSQESSWMQEKLLGNAINLRPDTLRFRGNLDVNAMKWALKEVVNRHDILRTLIKEEDGLPYQVICPKDTWEMKYTSKLTKKKDLDYYLKEEKQAKIDLTKDYGFRAHLIKLSDEEHKLILTFHHIVTDGVSEAIFADEVVEFYNAKKQYRKPNLQELKIQYADYAVWQRNYYTESVLEDKLEYWKTKLDGVTPLNLPTDFRRPPFITNNGNRTSLALEPSLTQKVKDFVKAEDVTEYIFFLTIYKVLLSRYCNQKDICVGSPVANRIRKEIEPLIGYFINSIPVRTIVDEDSSFSQLLMHVKKHVLEAYNYQDLPFEKIVNALKQRHPNRYPIYQVLFNLHNFEKPDVMGLEDLELYRDSAISYDMAEFDISLAIRERDGRYFLDLNYCTDLFMAKTANQFLRHFKHLIDFVLRDPNSSIQTLNLLDDSDLHKILIDLNDNSKVDLNAKTFLDIFHNQVSNNPNREVVHYQDQTLTYQELDEKSSQLANFLGEIGIDRGSIVPIYMDRSIEMIISLLGILKSGAAFAAIPLSLPKARVNYILSEVNPKAIVTFNKYVPIFSQTNSQIVSLDTIRFELMKESPCLNQILIEQNDLAYVVYTSGSTGRPKAVMTSHGSILNYLCAMIGPLEINQNTHFLALADYGFDGAYMELFIPLLTGGSITIASDIATRDGFILKNLLASTCPTHIHATPSKYNLLLDGGWKNHEKARILTGGEPLTSLLGKTLCELSDGKIWNLYGPTESTLYATYKILKKGDNITVGRPISNYQIYVVDSHFNLVPIGVTGEILIGGIGLAKGYLNDLNLTSDKFIQHKLNKNLDTRLYRTGDLGRWNHFGDLEVIGRMDNQIKIRGFRIELGEIEAVLNKHESVQSSVIKVENEANEASKKLIAYIIPLSAFDENTILNYLKLELPDYMIPKKLIRLEHFPLTRNGKIDKEALPDSTNHPTIIKKKQKPKTRLEKKVSYIWEELLMLTDIGVDDDFFSIGGNSLLAFRLIAKIKKVFGKELSVNTIFENPTISTLSKKLMSSKNKDKHKSLMVLNKNGDKVPFFFAPPVGGTPLSYEELSKELGSTQPFYGFVSKGLDGKSKPYENIHEMASAFIEELIRENPKGPYAIGGYSFGGSVAFELAFQLEKRGYPVKRLFILDTFSPSKIDIDYHKIYNLNYKEWIIFFSKLYNSISKGHNKSEVSISMKDFNGIKTKKEQLQIFHNKLQEVGEDFTFEQVKGNIDVYIKNSLMSYVAPNQVIKAPITLIKCTIEQKSLFPQENVDEMRRVLQDKWTQEDFGWGDFTYGNVSINQIQCSHSKLLNQPYVKEVSEILKRSISEKVLI
ncbi:amino acid adenylation domain-containing protein [Yeosuana marina]|uniref:amino acid adenylation domain-containing protein n=1 Tax=Yeosuana marina TaxID=1565536 RepID=UPI0030C8B741